MDSSRNKLLIWSFWNFEKWSGLETKKFAKKRNNYAFFQVTQFSFCQTKIEFLPWGHSFRENKIHLAFFSGNACKIGAMIQKNFEGKKAFRNNFKIFKWKTLGSLRETNLLSTLPLNKIYLSFLSENSQKILWTNCRNKIKQE